MIAELRALQSRINALGISAHIGQVPTGVGAPYALVSAPAHAIGDDLSLNGANGTIDSDQVRVRVTDATTGNVMVRLAAIRDNLSPGERATTLAVDGRNAVIAWVRSEGEPIVDRDVIDPALNRHPATGLDTYRIVSQPL